MSKLKSLWVGFGIALGTAVAAIVLFFSKNKFWKDGAEQVDVKTQANASVKEYEEAVQAKADELSAMKADEIVGAFHKVFGGKA